MNLLTVEVEIDHGRLTVASPELLPEHGRGVLTVVPGARAVRIETGRDGLPVILGAGGVITAALVREIEEFTL